MQTPTADDIVKDGTVTIEEAAEQTGLGRTYLYELIAARKIASCKVGKRRLIPRSEIRRLLSEALIPATASA